MSKLRQTFFLQNNYNPRLKLFAIRGSNLCRHIVEMNL